MHLCYVSDERFPSTHTDTQQMAMTMDALAGLGVRVELVAPRLTRGPHAEDQISALRRYYEVDDGFEVSLLETVDPEARNLVKTLHPLAAMRELRRIEPDLVYTRNAQIALLALALGHRVAFESYRIIDRRLPRLARALARVTRGRRFLGVVCHSKMSADAFLRSGVPSDKVRVIYNGISPAQMEPRLGRGAARRALGLAPEGALAVYAGHVRGRKGLESLAEVAAATPEVRHLWVGGDDDGAADWGRRCAHAAGATNVTVTGWLAASEVAPYLYAADALLVPPSSVPLALHGNTVLPMKLFGYLASGRAILAPDLPDLGELLSHGQNAWLFPANNVPAAVEALRRVVKDRALCDRLGQGATETARDLTWAARAAKIRDFLAERLEANA